ncbi:MAG TPA: UDP-N-acetylmuramoyl-L-alanine--D-glutamate ligase [Actinobacteria bacterium]|nr:UDP-N-acetylmuramoyl-L-alanine--D-glutamate ligase [Actinomycetota bacterium]
MNFKGKKVLVLGMAKSGMAAAKKLKSLGEEVYIIDIAKNSSLHSRALELNKEGILAHIGSQSLSYAEGKELIIISPGVPGDIPLIKRAKEMGIPVWSEIELAYQLAGSNPFIVGITGTNGKTTTTTLIGEMYKKSFPTIIAGNIGNPLVENLEAISSDTKFVVELSSFQLENIVEFRPRISVLLNITDDHLDRYIDIADYTQAKARLFENQSKDDYAILNFDDPLVWKLASSVNAKIIPFSKIKELNEGIFVKSGKVYFRYGGASEEVFLVDELRIKGEHNLDNAMASAAAALVGGVPISFVRNVLLNFKGLKHRVEYVGTVDGVEFYNDSKATNPDAVIKALTAFSSPVILLVGGRNKKNSFQGVAKASKGKVRALIVFGEAASEIKLAFCGLNITIEETESLIEATKRAAGISKNGDVVLLSPACASFDMFSDYKERGEVFRKAVLSLREDFYGLQKS